MSVKYMTMVAAHQTLNALILLGLLNAFVKQDTNWIMTKSRVLVSITMKTVQYFLLSNGTR